MNSRINLKRIIINSLFLGIGAVLHQIAPPILLGMKPDFSLVMLFIIMILNDEYKTCLCAGIVAGLIAAATTTFPGGQLANVVDKFITTNIIFLLLMPLRNILNNQVKIILISAFGTVVSGSVFLLTALLTVGLPASFNILFVSVVIPATLINTVAAFALFYVLNLAIRRTTARGFSIY
jgi:ABC-type multidrug transport system fused ATPase/permease subunit